MCFPADSMEKMSRVDAGGDSETTTEITEEDAVTSTTETPIPSTQQGTIDCNVVVVLFLPAKLMLKCFLLISFSERFVTVCLQYKVFN